MFLKFPVLEECAIANYIANEFIIDPRSAMDQIDSPDSDNIFRLFCNFLKEFGVENFNRFQMVGSVFDDLQKHPGLYSNVCTRINVSKAVGHFLARCDCYDWDFVDLLNPKKDKIQVVLSQLIGVHVEFFKRMHVIDELTPRFERKADEIRQKKKNVELLQDVVERKLIEVGEQEKDAEISRKKCVALEKELEAKETKIKNMQDRKNDWILKTRKLNDEKAALEAKVVKLEEIMSERRNLIIQSPEKLSEEVAELESRLYGKRKERQELESKKLESVKHHNILMDMLRRLSKIKPEKDRPLADVSKEIESKWSECCQELDLWMEKLVNAELYIEILESKLEKSKGKRRAIMRERSQFLKDFQKKTEALESMILELETSMTNIHLERDEKKRQAQEEHDRLVKDLGELEINRTRKREEYGRFKREIQKKCQDASEKLKKRCDLIMKIVKDRSEIPSQ